MIPRYLVMSRADYAARQRGAGYSYRGYEAMPWWLRVFVFATNQVLVDQSALVDQLSKNVACTWEIPCDLPSCARCTRRKEFNRP